MQLNVYLCGAESMISTVGQEFPCTFIDPFTAARSVPVFRHG